MRMLQSFGTTRRSTNASSDGPRSAGEVISQLRTVETSKQSGASPSNTDTYVPKKQISSAALAAEALAAEALAADAAEGGQHSTEQTERVDNNGGEQQWRHSSVDESIFQRNALDDLYKIVRE